jgi:hypothetical protein
VMSLICRVQPQQQLIPQLNSFAHVICFWLSCAGRGGAEWRWGDVVLGLSCEGNLSVMAVDINLRFARDPRVGCIFNL